MSKEVKRYGMCGFESGIVEMEDGPFVAWDDYDALLAERDARLLQVDTLTDWYSNSLDVIREITAALPGTQYMDPPDGGDVSVHEQVRRMAKDAERYRFLMRELGGSVSQVVMGSPTFSNEDVDAAIDAALQGAQP